MQTGKAVGLYRRPVTRGVHATEPAPSPWDSAGFQHPCGDQRGQNGTDADELIGEARAAIEHLSVRARVPALAAFTEEIEVAISDAQREGEVRSDIDSASIAAGLESIVLMMLMGAL